MSDDSPQKPIPPLPPEPSRPDGAPSRETFEGTRFEDGRMQRVHAQLMREKEEPTENFSPMPMIFVALFMGLSFWAGIYLIRTSGNFDAFHFDETQDPGALVADAGPAEIDMVAMGRGVYSRSCQVCHQGSAEGLPNIYPPLANADWMSDNPDRLIKVILSGLSGPIEVNGNTYNNAMTPFGQVLSDLQIAAVLTYLRTADDLGNNSYPVSEERVAAVRADYGARRESWSEPELEAIHGPVTGQWTPDAEEAPAEELEEAPAEEGPVAEEAEDEETELTPAQSALGGDD